jgi:dolichol-phosphate mannosyltransferase
MVKKTISFVIPVFNEEENVIPCYEKLVSKSNILKDKFSFEFIFTDNHSDDKTFELLKDLNAHDNRVKVYRFSKNFGYQKSILTGYFKSKGDACIQIDCDLQDPIDMIFDFINLWQAGNKVVYGIRQNRQEHVLLNFSRKFFYRLINTLSEIDLPHDAGDFRLIDREIIDALRMIDDATPYIRGTISSIGFKQVGIVYNRQARTRGKSKFSFFDLVAFAADGIVNHSIVPLRIATFFGIIISLITVLLMPVYLIIKFFYNFDLPPGFTTLVLFSLFGISLNALLLGIIGEYLGRIYKQVKKGPLTLIESALE